MAVHVTSRGVLPGSNAATIVLSTVQCNVIDIVRRGEVLSLGKAFVPGGVMWVVRGCGAE